ncbi:MAG: DNA polymerase III subunit alpha [Pseudomonadota bacterium]
MTGSFVHLGVHTDHSLVDGVARIKPLVGAVAEAGMPAVALTEQCNLYSLVKFYRAATAAGVKPIIGADLWLADHFAGDEPTRLTVLAQNNSGYRNLCELLTLGFRDGQRGGTPTVSRDWLERQNAGLIVLSGGTGGEVGQLLLSDRAELAYERARYWQTHFRDRFYLTVQRTGRMGEAQYLDAAYELALKAELPLVATNDVRFLTRADFAAHEARVCIYEGRTLADPRRPRRYTEQQYLRSPAEMRALFEDLPEALQNSVEIARRCSAEVRLGETFLPDFPVPDGFTTESWFEQISREGLERRLQVLFGGYDAGELGAARVEYDERLSMELGVIVQMGFPGYFLIVADFIQWARDNGVPVGPGRGSGAGSLVAYALGITDLDPIGYDLLFERFLNPERVSMPDFDVDFCMEGRDRVIDYVAQRYGADKVAQIITFGTMAAKAVVRDVGRVLGHPYGFVDQIAKLIPFEVGMTLDKALAEEEALRERYNTDEEVRALIDLARSLEGVARNPGRHAGGVVIAPSAMSDFSPLYFEQAGGSPVTQFDKDDVEAAGLVKFDFLGLRTLTIIDWALKSINAERERTGDAAVDIDTIATDDARTFELVMSAATTAIFQLESRGMRELIRKLKPDCFEDIVALVALFRPGPLQSGMVDDFIDRKHGRAAVEYPHPDLEPILKPTYGVILYQEQVMQIAQVLAGYSLGGADLLRRAMGKKKPEEMAKQRSIFIDGSVARGVDEAVASYIFDLMEKFAGYGFNRSHSAAYALVSYQTAWLKSYFPAHFMAAVLSADMDSTDKVVTLIDECRAQRLRVSPPDINQCNWKFTAEDDGRIRYGLGAVKGVGQAAIEALVEEREQHGPFTDLFDLCVRIDGRKINKRVLEALIKSGSLDAIAPGRAECMASLAHALARAEQHARDAVAGQDDMFGGTAATPAAPVAYLEADEWREDQRLQGEKETLGLYLTGHPVNRYREELGELVKSRLSQLQPDPKRSQRAAGLVVAMRVMNSRRGRMAAVTLDDGSARVEVVLYSDVFQRVQQYLAKDRVLIAEGVVSVDEFTGGSAMTADDIYDIEEARLRFARAVIVQLPVRDGGCDAEATLAALRDTLDPYRDGAARLYIAYARQDAEALLPCGDGWRVSPREELLERLRNVNGLGEVAVRY